jgi:hypothetical protein
LTQLRSKIFFTIRFFQEIEKYSQEKEVGFDAAYEKINSMVLKMAYKFYEGKKACYRHRICYDNFPFEYNVVGILEGESRDYDIFIAKHKQQYELERTIEQFKSEK